MCFNLIPRGLEQKRFTYELYRSIRVITMTVLSVVRYALSLIKHL